MNIARHIAPALRWAAGLALVVMLGAVSATTTGHPHALVPALRHGMQPPAGIGGPLDLLDHHGRRFDLHRIAGRPALLFFGFTHCASTCPMALLTASRLLQAADPSHAPAVLFVTLEPLADQPRELAAHLGRIDARIVGLTGQPDQVERAADLYGVALRHQGQVLEHSSMWYLLDGAGQVARVYPFATPAEHLIADARRLSRS